MSRITQELRELVQIACLLGKANGSVEVRTSRSPEYHERDLFKKLLETVQLKIDALAKIPDAEYVAMVIGEEQGKIKIELGGELKDSVEQHTIDTTKEPESGADPRD